MPFLRHVTAISRLKHLLNSRRPSRTLRAEAIFKFISFHLISIVQTISTYLWLQGRALHREPFLVDERRSPNSTIMPTAYKIEVSPNRRSKCRDRTCLLDSVKIEKGELRFAVWLILPDLELWSYKHW
jgi:hypothetical protein